MPLEIKNIYIDDVEHTRYNVDNLDIEISDYDGHPTTVSINREEAKQIIAHLQKQFEL